MKQQSRLAGSLLLLWMALVMTLFILIMIPPDSSLARALPSAFWNLRSVVYSFFYSQSAYE